MSILRSLLSSQAKNKLRRTLNQSLPIGASSESAAVHAAASCRNIQPYYHIAMDTLKGMPSADGLPLPPPELRMGYLPHSDAAYLESGRETASRLMKTVQSFGCALGAEARMLELGCATGRVLRHFQSEAASREVWGCDQHEESILWAKANLCPPFRFVTVMRLPHLPFEDNHFGLIYGVSVFTHIEFLVDTWILELRRVLAPGACLLLSVHDESSVAALRKNGHPAWLDAEIPLDVLGVQDCTVVPWGAPNTAPRHDAALPFYRSEYLKKEWGQYFKRCEIFPIGLDGVQSLIALQK